MRNCINCMAPIDMSANKCPYCDTPYYIYEPKLTQGRNDYKVQREIIRAEYKCLENGIFTVNEIRELMNL